MANFQDILTKIQTAAQIAQAVEPALAQYSTDHVAATQNILQIAGAGVAAEVSDPQIQQEAVASAQIASTLVPLFFQFFALFHHKKAA